MGFPDEGTGHMAQETGMGLFKSVMVGVLITLMCGAPSSCSKKETPRIRIAGSSTIHPLMVRISESYSGKGDVEVQVASGGSLKGAEALLAGTCDVAMCSAPIPADMLNQAASKGIQIKGFGFAHDMIVPIVHPSNRVTTLSIEQLGGIYNGTIESWSAINGTSAPIRVVARSASSGTREVWNRQVPVSPAKKEHWVIQDSSSGVLADVAQHPEAIGYVSFAILNHEVKALSVNGVAPTVDNARSGRYPISRQLYLYVNEKDLSFAVKSLIVFVLSNRGQEIVEDSGFIPQNALIK